MKTIKLYTGGGVSFSEEYAEGRVESPYVRLVADEGMMLKKGDITVFNIDILVSDAPNWTEVDFVEDEEAEIEDYENALTELGVRV